MKRIIIIGAGQLGSYLNKNLKVEDSVIDIIDYPNFDITKQDQVADIVNKYDIIINAAAYTNVDGAETDQLKCMAVNSSGPITFAGDVLTRMNKKFIHISSEVVYGSNDPNYKLLTEESSKNPTCAYSRSKKLADDYIENLMKLNIENLLLLRPGWLFGPNNDHNFIEKIRKLLTEKEEIKVVNDQIGTLTHVSLIVHAIEDYINGKLPGDVFNIGNEGIASRYEVACYIKELINSNCKINECTSDEFKRVANIAKNSSLDCSKIDKFITFKRPNWKDDVKRVLLEENNK